MSYTCKKYSTQYGHCTGFSYKPMMPYGNRCSKAQSAEHQVPVPVRCPVPYRYSQYALYRT
jgi:hypothetical protein